MNPQDVITKTRAVIEAATPGPWCAEISPAYIVGARLEDGRGADVCTDQYIQSADRAHIATFDPTTASLVLDLLEVIPDCVHSTAPDFPCAWAHCKARQALLERLSERLGS